MRRMSKLAVMKTKTNVLLAVVALATAGAGYACWPRTPHLRGFSPTDMGGLETDMWRAYYDRHYAALIGCLYRVNRDDYGFSPLDSALVAYYAAKAAKIFQPTTSRAEAQAALPSLEAYFELIRRRSHEPFDVASAARTELDWWQLRREHVTFEDYGKVVAKVAAEVYRASNQEIRRAGQLRAEMMDYRDQRGDGRMKEADWQHIRENLVESYALLKKGVARSEFDLRANLHDPVRGESEEVGGRAGIARKEAE